MVSMIDVRKGRACRAVLALSVLLAPACGGGGPVTPTTVQSPPPSKAEISVTVNSPTLNRSRISGFAYQIDFGLHVTESAGVGANLDFVRMEVYSSTGAMLERLEIGSNAFTGGNRLGASSTRDFNVSMGFNSDPLTGRYVLIGLGATDDRGNVNLIVTPRLNF